ncbi:aspartic proteinase cdr1 [Quercus suber]|uniref:Aspartic proteinase cdr1 n=1 Tax=Quercus suber TaxID=58331 RepID=A0AAW0J0Q0_QUESU
MASGVKFHSYFLLSYYLIGLLVTTHNVPQAQLIPYYGQHLTKASIGTPPIDICNAIDTTSDLVWTECVPCDVCFSRIHPKFDPKSCNYVYGYTSGLTKGVLAKENATITSTFGQAVSFDIAFGCAHNNTVHYNDHTTRIIGLGLGPFSFPSQIGSKRFSYCLLPNGTEYTDPSIKGKISFGNGSEVVGDGVVSTPFVALEDQYYVTLEGIRVGDTCPFTLQGRFLRATFVSIQDNRH